MKLDEFHIFVYDIYLTRLELLALSVESRFPFAACRGVLFLYKCLAKLGKKQGHSQRECRSSPLHLWCLIFRTPHVGTFIAWNKEKAEQSCRFKLNSHCNECSLCCEISGIGRESAQLPQLEVKYAEVGKVLLSSKMALFFLSYLQNSIAKASILLHAVLCVHWKCLLYHSF